MKSPLSADPQVPEVCRLAPATRRTLWFTAENPTGVRGAAHTDNDGRKRRASAELRPGERIDLAVVGDGPGIIRRIWLTFFGLQERDCPHFLRGLRLQVVYDGGSRPAVDAPVGDYFCQGLGRATALDNRFFSSPEGRSLVSCLPMPFRKGVRMTLINESPFLCRKVYYEVNATVGDELPADIGYLHAHWRRETRTTMMSDYAILPPVRGRGRYLGACLSVLPDQGRYAATWWGEGEVKVYLDGDKDFPTLCGTGTEDYVGTGWGQRQFAQTYQGSPVAEKNDLEFAYAFYRLHDPDPVDFHQEIRVTVQQIGSWSRVEDLRTVLERKTDLRLKGGGPFIPPENGPLPSFSHFEREDDWSSLCWFYLDRPENDLPPLAGYDERVFRLVPSLLRRWRVLGPFPGAARGAVSLDDEPPFDFDVASPSLGAGEALAWKNAEARPDGFVDLGGALEPREWALAFAVAEFESPGEETVTLAFSADDGIRLWLNGEHLAESDEAGAYSQALPNRVRVRLRPGRNRLVAKITNYTAGWGFGIGFLGNTAVVLP
jgi:hypothetical protein